MPGSVIDDDDDDEDIMSDLPKFATVFRSIRKIQCAHIILVDQFVQSSI
jgi:hypothetical protein